MNPTNRYHLWLAELSPGEPGGSMQLGGQIEIAAPRQAVWGRLTDPHYIAECVPAQASIETLDDRNLRVTAEVGNGFMRTTVTVEIEMTEMTPPERASATATAAVMASPLVATGSLVLEEIGPSLTGVQWSAEVTLGGMLVGFAAMVEGPLKRGIADTLDCLKARIEAEAAPLGAV
jgi:carbon monoxide dehydrogenase subunit G